MIIAFNLLKFYLSAHAGVEQTESSDVNRGLNLSRVAEWVWKAGFAAAGLGYRKNGERTAISSIM